MTATWTHAVMVAAVAGSTAAVLLASAGSPPPAAPAAAGVAQDVGRAIFEGKGNCATCHAKNATGTPLGPDLTDDEWLNVDGTLAQITAVIRTGVPKPVKYPAPMPPMGGARLRDAEITAVAAYVRGLGPKQGAGVGPAGSGAYR